MLPQVAVFELSGHERMHHDDRPLEPRNGLRGVAQ